ERARIAENIREAKSHGDLRENAMYHEAKLNQTRLEARISELDRMLQVARIVEEGSGDGSATLGSKVTLEDLEYGDNFTIELVGAFDADP
ncbi:transcription elongation factor GreA, partial [Acinetobacter baumannii]